MDFLPKRVLSLSTALVANGSAQVHAQDLTPVMRCKYTLWEQQALENRAYRRVGRLTEVLLIRLRRIRGTKVAQVFLKMVRWSILFVTLCQ
jgi:hypothetical protein